jgi:hypothetical protein
MQMDEERLRKVFHSVFNKINNITIACAANRKILQGEDLGKLSAEELRRRIHDLLDVLTRIEENASILSSDLQDFYGSIKGICGYIPTDTE